MSLELPTANSSEPASSQRKAGEAGSDSRKAARCGVSRCSLTSQTMTTHAQQRRG